MIWLFISGEKNKGAISNATSLRQKLKAGAYQFRKKKQTDDFRNDLRHKQCWFNDKKVAVVSFLRENR